MTRFANLHVSSHPLVEHKLSLMRDRGADSRTVRELAGQIATLLAVEVTRGLAGEAVRIETPLEAMRARQVREDRIVLVPILRAGLGMVEGVLHLLPDARVAHLGFYRNEETLQPVAYYARTPPRTRECTFLLLDPMVGTGGTACAGIAELKERGARSITMLALVAAPEGVGRMAEEHPDVPLHVAALDRQLNDAGYILPGLGDAGDRIFGL